MKKLAIMYSFSSKLWYDKRWVSKSGDVSLYLQVNLDGKHAEFPLKLRWPAKFIDLADGILLPRRKRDAEVSDYNLMVRLEQAKHTEILWTYRIKNAPLDLAQFKRELTVFNKRDSFLSYMRRECLSRYTLKEIDRRTYLNHNSAVNRMAEFDDQWLFDQLTVKWMQRFKQHLVNLGYEPGGVWSVMKCVKAYLQRARLEPMMHVDEPVADFANPQPKWKTNYLNKQELNQLIMLYSKNELPQNKQDVLRAFIFSCFTSLRISDVYRANGAWRVNEGSIEFIPKKNEKRQKWVTVPVSPIAASFIMNTAGKYFDLPSEKEYNLILKDLAAAAGINKHLTSHFGRHTYGYIYMTTIGNLKGLKEIMGHSKVATTDRYAHIDEDYKLQSVMKIQEEFLTLFPDTAKLLKKKKK